MKKTIFKTSGALLFALLLCSISGSAQGDYHVGVTWGSEYGQESAENLEHFYVCSDIHYEFESTSGWVSNNFFGGSTTASNVYQCSDDVRDTPSYDYLATFHVGHMWPNMVEYGHWELDYYDEYGMPHFVWVVDGEVRHYAYYGSQGSYNGIEDAYMYSHGGAKNYFSMIWTCTNADLFYNQGTEYGYYESAHGTGVVGMPYAWTQLLNLDTTGYGANPGASDFCYIGFENVSKTFLEAFEGSATYNYGDFVRQFFHHALNHNDPINTALDHATNDMGVYQITAFNSPNNDLYYGWDEEVEGFEDPWRCIMRVYGDGSNTLGGT